MDIKGDFLKKYNLLEQWCVNRGYKDVYDFEANETWGATRNELKYYRNIRNALTHNPRVEKRMVLTEVFVKDFEKLCHSLMAELKDVAISIDDIFRRQMSDTIGPTIRVMKERVFTHTPIMNGKRVWGVFSENTLFNLAGKDEFSRFNGSTTFLDIASYITEYNRTSVYDFISPNVSLDDVKKKFRNATENGRKLEVLFITTTGSRDGNLVGMITVWDLTTI